MAKFLHNEVLFTGDDGLALEFNIQNTTEKEHLKALIEHGGGMCTLSDEAIILVSPGTKVLNVLANKNLISSRFVLDCVKEDCLLDTDEYRIEINEMEASDFSDNSLSLQVNSLLDYTVKLPNDVADNSINLIQSPKTLSPSNVICPNDSNHDFDFLDSENRNTAAEIHKSGEQHNSHLEISLQSSENHIHFGVHTDENDNFMSDANEIADSLETCKQSTNARERKETNLKSNVNESTAVSSDNDPSIAVVSSSQENHIGLDKFDNMILNKVQENPVTNEDSLSQSYTVSSSADVQISPNQVPPPHNTSAEIFSGSSAVPDSASQTTERQQYISNLEKEIDEILKKPSPKSIQDKVVFVKYICTVKKLPPAVVLQTLQKLQR